MSRALFVPLLLAALPLDVLQERRLVVAVEVNLVVHAVGGVARLAACSTMSGSPAIAQSVGIQSLWLINSLLTVPGLIVPRPADQARHAEGALPVGVLLASGTRSWRRPASEFMCGPLSLE